MALVQAVVERAGVPIVLDADGLFAFVGESDRLMGRDDAEIIITPHPGEMARLTGLTVEAVQANRVEVARTFATTHRVHVILKGHRTVVATPDGKAFINLTGNPGGMAAIPGTSSPAWWRPGSPSSWIRRMPRSSLSTFMALPETWPRPTRGKSRWWPAILSIGSAMRCWN